MNPEIKEFENKKKVAKFSMATSEKYKNGKGEMITDTHWHNMVAWGRQADVIEKFLKKGSEVAVEGKLINRAYIDKQGVKRYITGVQINEILMIKGK
jgi:single-strand DNA-binding protein